MKEEEWKGNRTDAVRLVWSMADRDRLCNGLIDGFRHRLRSRQPVSPVRVADSLLKFPSIQGFLIVTAVHFG